jgi:hypothetical protein
MDMMGYGYNETKNSARFSSEVKSKPPAIESGIVSYKSQAGKF